jgi:hypothetical protein
MPKNLQCKGSIYCKNCSQKNPELCVYQKNMYKSTAENPNIKIMVNKISTRNLTFKRNKSNFE